MMFLKFCVRHDTTMCHKNQIENEFLVGQINLNESCSTLRYESGDIMNVEKGARRKLCFSQHHL